MSESRTLEKSTTSIDVNADLGEGCPNDERLLDLVTSASISCGAHAGDEEAILATLTAAARRGVSVGAHPGYADRASFGRKELNLAPDEVTRLVESQAESLAKLARSCGLTLGFLKPHGALY